MRYLLFLAFIFLTWNANSQSMHAVSFDVVHTLAKRAKVSYEQSISPSWTIEGISEYRFGENNTVGGLTSDLPYESFRSQEYRVQLGLKRYLFSGYNYNKAHIGAYTAIGWETYIEDGYEEALLKVYNEKYKREVPQDIIVGLQAGYKWNFWQSFFLEPNVDFHVFVDEFFGKPSSLDLGMNLGIELGYRFGKNEDNEIVD